MPTRSAKVIQVIQTMTSVGTGTEVDPNRILLEFWSLDGQRLAVNDPIIQDTSPPPSPSQSRQ